MIYAIVKQLVLLSLKAAYTMSESGVSEQNNLFYLVMVSDAFRTTITLVNKQILRKLHGKVTLLTKNIKN